VVVDLETTGRQPPDDDEAAAENFEMDACRAARTLLSA
jgi:hypothetical protein